MQNCILGNVTRPEWSEVIGFRVEASWNLHSLLPLHTEFVILLSSRAVIYGSIF